MLKSMKRILRQSDHPKNSKTIKRKESCSMQNIIISKNKSFFSTLKSNLKFSLSIPLKLVKLNIEYGHSSLVFFFCNIKS